MRLFFAVLLPDEVREAVARVQAELRAEAGEDGIKWVAPEQFHYTLKFLGETPESDVPAAIDTAKIVSALSSPFSLTLSGVGAFPQQRSPQILWVGAAEGVPLLTRLAESLDRSLAERGFALETRRFNPHLMLARVKTRRGEEAVARALRASNRTLKNVDKIGVFVIQYFVLMRSELQRSGPVYTVLETFSLVTK